MKKLKLLLLTSLFVSFYVHAEPQWCTGTINNLYLDAAGQLVINGSWRDGNTVICNVLADRKGTKSEVCKGWLSMAMTASVSGNEVLVHYSDEVSCAAIETYAASPAPIYVMLK